MAAYSRTVTNNVTLTDTFTSFSYTATMGSTLGNTGIVPIWVYETVSDDVTIAETISNPHTHGSDRIVSFIETVQVFDSPQFSMFLHLSSESVNTATDHCTAAEVVLLSIIRGTSRRVGDSIEIIEWIIPKNKNDLLAQFIEQISVLESRRNPNIEISVEEQAAVQEIVQAVDTVLSTGKNIVLLTVNEYGMAAEVILEAVRGERFLHNIAVAELIEAIRQNNPARSLLGLGGEVVAWSETITPDALRPIGQSGSVAESIGMRIDPFRTVIDASGVSEWIIPIIQRKAATAAGAGSQQTANATINGNALATYNGFSNPTSVTFTTSSYSITLRKPKFGDDDRYGVFRIQQESRGRELIIYQDKAWPTTEAFIFEFEYLTQSVSQALITFLGETVGQKVTYHDHFGRSWDGFIKNPDTAVEQVGKTNFTAKIEFQVINP